MMKIVWMQQLIMLLYVGQHSLLELDYGSLAVAFRQPFKKNKDELKQS
jgi:hypothetical protein